MLITLAHTLCELYLGADTPDTIHLDDVILRIDRDERPELRKWPVGANYFAAQGDGRWWRDHRIPGGLGFSMNSVGHMARFKAENALLKNPDLARQADSIPREKLVYFALRYAMQTIGVQETESTRGTWLAEHGAFDEDREPPPYEDRRRFFGELAEFSENRYRGLYHTDQTIPTLYFDDGLWRGRTCPVRDDLYFTYLHSLADTDYLTMGLGIDLHSAQENRASQEVDEDLIETALEQRIVAALNGTLEKPPWGG